MFFCLAGTLLTFDPTQLAHSLTLDLRPEYHRACLTWVADSPVPMATSTGSQCSSRLASMRSADALLILPPAREGLRELVEGTIVQAILLKRT